MEHPLCDRKPGRVGGEGLTITTKPTRNQHGVFRFPVEPETKTDGWACVNEMPVKPLEFLDHESCASFPQGWWLGTCDDALSWDKRPGDRVVTQGSPSQWCKRDVIAFNQASLASSLQWVRVERWDQCLQRWKLQQKPGIWATSAQQGSFPCFPGSRTSQDWGRSPKPLFSCGSLASLDLASSSKGKRAVQGIRQNNNVPPDFQRS